MVLKNHFETALRYVSIRNKKCVLGFQKNATSNLVQDQLCTVDLVGNVALLVTHAPDVGGDLVHDIHRSRRWRNP